ncbi:hypothetical protein ACTOB_005261 [Actinoplanes oblitus]|uniref:Uncharacterized protein n=1 Tax=Actinoplanes oblitus TaxID=3040509 RepID=A0ABY8W845_9ACTN|nr:hypothetical protein [Actinoplanes oblitus]WIM93286.1 hypothetical protein ACTOB_005261 [Actinoplanes oblitus]
MINGRPVLLGGYAARAVRAAVESRAGVGLKTVAVHGAGFRWRDDDPVGRQCQEWHQRARVGDRAAASLQRG